MNKANKMSTEEKKQRESLRLKRLRKRRKEELLELRALREYISKKYPEQLKDFETEYHNASSQVGPVVQVNPEAPTSPIEPEIVTPRLVPIINTPVFEVHLKFSL